MQLKYKNIVLGIVSVLSIISIILIVTSLSGYIKRQKEYRTPLGWALEEAKVDFFSKREQEDFCVYEISEMSLINYKAESWDGECFKVFYVKIVDNYYNLKEYYVAIGYNLDNSFWATFYRGVGRKELIGVEHIEWLDADLIYNSLVIK